MYFLNWSMKTFLGSPLKPQLLIVTEPSDFSAAAISSLLIPVAEAADDEADALAPADALSDAAALAELHLRMPAHWPQRHSQRPMPRATPRLTCWALPTLPNCYIRQASTRRSPRILPVWAFD